MKCFDATSVIQTKKIKIGRYELFVEMHKEGACVLRLFRGKGDEHGAKK